MTGSTSDAAKGWLGWRDTAAQESG